MEVPVWTLPGQLHTQVSSVWLLNASHRLHLLYVLYIAVDLKTTLPSSRMQDMCVVVKHVSLYYFNVKGNSTRATLCTLHSAFR